jgi:hypothetical protein
MSLTRQEIIERLQAARLDLPPPPPPPPKPAVERAKEVFTAEAKPTDAMLQDAEAHNRALRHRLQRQHEEYMRQLAQAPSAHQRQVDQAWEDMLEHKRELEEIAGRTCHRGLGDPDYWSR